MTLKQPYVTPQGRPIVEGGYPQAGGEAPFFDAQYGASSADNVPATSPTNTWSFTGTTAYKHLWADNGSPGVATLTLNSSDTNSWLRVLNYGFSLPGTATLVGIEVDVKWNSIGTNVSANIHVSYGASAATLSATDNGGAISASADSVVTYGGEADLWGETAGNLATALGTTDFGVSIRPSTTEVGDQTCQVDFATVRIYYTITAAGNVRVDQQYAEVLTETDSDVRVTQHYVELLRSEAVTVDGLRYQRVIVVT